VRGVNGHRGGLGGLLLVALNGCGKDPFDGSLILLAASEAYVGLLQLDERLVGEWRRRVGGGGSKIRVASQNLENAILGTNLKDELLQKALILGTGFAELGELLLGAALEIIDDVLASLEDFKARLIELIRVGTKKKKKEKKVNRNAAEVREGVNGGLAYIFLSLSNFFSFRSYSFLIFCFSAWTILAFSIVNSSAALSKISIFFSLASFRMKACMFSICFLTWSAFIVDGWWRKRMGECLGFN